MCACAHCKNCDGFACLYHNVWIDNGTIEIEHGKFITITEYGNMICNNMRCSFLDKIKIYFRRFFSF